MKRTNEEYILLALCVAGILGIFPFVIIRILRSELLNAALDGTLVLGVIAIGLYVWKTRSVRVPSIILTIFYLFGMVAIVNINGISLIYWAFPTMTGAYFLLKPKEAVFANVIALLLFMPLLLQLDFIGFLSILITLVLNNIFSFIFSRTMHIHQAILTAQATRDSLTGAGNRWLFDENILECIAQKRRNHENVAMIMLDIDHFKKINDEFGHLTGDEVLVKLKGMLRSRLRESDGLYRIGGEEFAILLKRTDGKAAVALAEKLRLMVENSDLLPERTVTISLGVAQCRTDDNARSWLKRADRVLYQAKNTGRNRTCLEE